MAESIINWVLANDCKASPLPRQQENRPLAAAYDIIAQEWDDPSDRQKSRTGSGAPLVQPEPTSQKANQDGCVAKKAQPLSSLDFSSLPQMDRAVESAGFYQDENLSTQLMSGYLFDKTALQLNLEPLATVDQKIQDMKRNSTPSELRSPDLGFLKLGSPELEKIILSLQNNPATAGNSAALNAPARPAAGQENTAPYTRGFADALQDLHDRQSARPSLADNASASSDPFLGAQNCGTASYVGTVRTSDVGAFSSGLVSGAVPEQFTTPGGAHLAARGSAVYPSYATDSNAAGLAPLYGLYPPESSYDGVHGYHEYDMEKPTPLRTFTGYDNAYVQHKSETAFKFDGQTAQVVTAEQGSLTPIDLEIQEVVKRERKKQRNRVASSKCRKRKLEREARLEVRVKDLKERNIELNAVANALKQQVCDLKQRVMEHVGEGCHIMLNHQSQIWGDGWSWHNMPNFVTKIQPSM